MRLPAASASSTTSTSTSSTTTAPQASYLTARTSTPPSTAAARRRPSSSTPSTSSRPSRRRTRTRRPRRRRASASGARHADTANAACLPPRNSHLTPRTRCRLGFVFFRLILFPAWLYLFISDMRNHPEQTWDLMNGFERYGYILSKHRRRTPAPPPALRTRLSEHICVSQPVAQPTSCCSRCR